jgi:hypothetical protein
MKNPQYLERWTVYVYISTPILDIAIVLVSNDCPFPSTNISHPYNVAERWQKRQPDTCLGRYLQQKAVKWQVLVTACVARATACC